MRGTRKTSCEIMVMAAPQQPAELRLGQFVRLLRVEPRLMSERFPVSCDKFCRRD